MIGMATFTHGKSFARFFAARGTDVSSHSVFLECGISTRFAPGNYALVSAFLRLRYVLR